MSTRLAPVLILAAATLAGCKKNTESRPPADTGDAPPRSEAYEAAVDDADTGITSPELAQLLRDHWAAMLQNNPVHATELGIHDFDDRLTTPGAEARAARKTQTKALLARANAIDPASLTQDERTSHSIFVGNLDVGLRGDVCRYETWSMSPRDNALAQVNELAEVHPVGSEADAQTLLLRYQAMPEHIDARIADLRSGLESQRVAPADSVKRVIAMTRDELQKPPGEWAIVVSARKADAAPDLAGDLETVIESSLAPKLREYADMLEAEVLPQARSDAQPGVMHVPDGAACYEVMIEQYTTMDKSADEIHQTGLDEMARINAEMEELGAKLFNTRDLGEILERLRTDPELYFETSEEVQAFAESALAKAKGRMPEFFRTLPKADCVVTPVPDYEAPFTYIAYYRQPVPDGSKPGQYFVNTYAPQTRPIYEARVLAAHESIPGHHLQIAIGQELEAVPAFRKHGGETVFVEGWALYTERLGEEMGLYETDLDRMGVLSFDAWRAGRLVVDTGIHAKGWSRQQAIDYLTEHTALAPNNIDNEVDRYITWPGQALGYKMGQLEILAMRADAREQLGDAFELGAFHDAILLGGAMPMSALHARVDRYIAEAKEG